MWSVITIFVSSSASVDPSTARVCNLVFVHIARTPAYQIQCTANTNCPLRLKRRKVPSVVQWRCRYYSGVVFNQPQGQTMR